MGLGCNRANARPPVKYSKITQFLYELSSNDENLPYNFLLLLDDDAFEKSCPLFPSLKNRIKKKIKGSKLLIERYSNLSNIEYPIDETPEVNKLYIMLPKERMFIDPKNYDTRLLESKMQELSLIFMDLGAHEIEITTIHKTSNSESTSFGADVNVNHIDVGTNAELSNSNSNTHEIKEHLTFPKIDDYKLEVNKLSRYQYLCKNFRWRNIIIKRVDGLLEKFDYELENSEENEKATKIVEKLKLFNISVSHNNEQFVTNRKKYTVKFNTLKKENILYGNEEKDNSSQEDSISESVCVKDVNIDVV